MSPDPTLPADPLIGATVGEYLVVEQIGQGGMGVVYRAVQPVIGKRVALKVLKAVEGAEDPQGKRLIAEAEAVNDIRHRGIIDIFGFGQLLDGRPYVVMEFLEGEPLDEALARERRPPVAEVLRLLIEICGPLEAAHRAGVVHRDLKPSNVFLCAQPDGTRYLKLLDFGLAKRVESLSGSSAQSGQTLVAGTPDYMAPEQARGLPISARTDVYALGVIAWELLGGHAPFVGLSPIDVMVAHVSAPVPPLPPGLDVPPRLEQLVRRMLSKFPEDRPATVAEVRAALEALAAAPFSDAQPVAPRPSRRGLVVASVTALLGLVLWVTRTPEPAPRAAPEPPETLNSHPTTEPDPSEPTTAMDAGTLEAAALPPPAPLPPTTRALLERITQLEDHTRTAADFDPSAAPFLQVMRRRLTADHSEATRRQVAGELKLWEGRYLR